MPSSAQIYRVLTGISGAAVRRFYRITALGEAVPAQGPLLIVANHPNGLVDPLLLIELCPRPLRLLAKATLFPMPFIGWWVRGFGCLPVYRAKDGADTSKNAQTFEAVERALLAGDAVCLFPEGVSHSEPALQRLKTGAARMALNAELRARGAGGAPRELALRILPVGLLYRDKASFQSRVAVWIGAPIECADLVEAHARGEWSAVEALNERIERALRRVTLNLDRWDELPLLELAERVWRRGEGRRVKRLRALAEGLRELRVRDAARAQALLARGTELADRLARVGLGVDDLYADHSLPNALRFALLNALALALGLPLALLGAAAWFLPYQFVRAAAALARPTEDVAATVKLVAAICIYPPWWLLLGWIALERLPFGLALGGWLLLPGLGLFATQFWLRRRAAWADARAFLRVGRHARLKQHLLRECEALAAEIERAASALG